MQLSRPSPDMFAYRRLVGFMFQRHSNRSNAYMICVFVSMCHKRGAFGLLWLSSNPNSTAPFLHAFRYVGGLGMAVWRNTCICCTMRFSKTAFTSKSSGSGSLSENGVLQNVVLMSFENPPKKVSSFLPKCFGKKVIRVNQEFNSNLQTTCIIFSKSWSFLGIWTLDIWCPFCEVTLNQLTIGKSYKLMDQMLRPVSREILLHPW